MSRMIMSNPPPPFDRCMLKEKRKKKKKVCITTQKAERPSLDVDGLHHVHVPTKYNDYFSTLDRDLHEFKI